MPLQIRTIRIIRSAFDPTIEIVGYYFAKTTFLVGQTFLSVNINAQQAGMPVLPMLCLPLLRSLFRLQSFHTFPDGFPLQLDMLAFGEIVPPGELGFDMSAGGAIQAFDAGFLFDIGIGIQIRGAFRRTFLAF